jgi:hypothetical protein
MPPLSGMQRPKNVDPERGGSMEIGKRAIYAISNVGKQRNFNIGEAADYYLEIAPVVFSTPLRKIAVML